MKWRGVVVDRTGRSILDNEGKSVLGDAWDLTLIVSKNLVGDVPGVDIIEVGELSGQALSAATARVHQSGGIHRIATISENMLLKVAELREAFGIAGHSVEYVTRLRDKWSMKAKAIEAGIRHNPGLLADEVLAGHAILSSQRGYVLKPRAGSGSRGVRMFTHWNEVIRAVIDLEDRNGYLVEICNSAEMLHVDGYIADGRPVMQVSRYLRPCHTTGGKVPLSSITVDDHRTRGAAVAFVSSILRAWEIRSDVFHCEVFASKDGMTLCEIAGRPGGAGVPEVFAATHGVDLRHAKLRLDFGLDPTQDQALPAARHGGWTVIYPPTSDAHYVDDSSLTGHHTRNVLSPADPWVEGLAGVGIATYSFADESIGRVLELVQLYEKRVRILPIESQRRDLVD